MADDDHHECPTCGRDDFASERGLKVHHARAHDESLVDHVVKKCANCGSTVEAHPTRAEGRDNLFCSKNCETTHRTKTARQEWPVLNCENCAGEYRIPHHEEERSRFCSKSCRSSYVASQANSKPREKVSCESCGDTIEVTPSEAESTRFCSRACYGEWMSRNLTGKNNPNYRRVSLECVVCGSEFDVKPFRSEEAQACSPECGAKITAKKLSGDNHYNWKGGQTFRYGEGWTPRKRRRVRIRDQARCQHCGRTESDHLDEFGTKHAVHHITPARQVDDAETRNAMENLITLCRGACHRTWEQMAPLRPDTSTTAD